jgi:hypothetical protein
MKTLTLAETLHPEAAEDHINPQNGASNAWGTFFKEVREDIPVAVAYKVEEDEETSVQAMEVATVPKADHTNQTDDKHTEKSVGRGCFYLEGLIGCTLTFSAVVVTFSIELSAAICYCLAAAIHKVASNGEMVIFVRAVLLLIVQSLMITDAIMLTMSVLLTEVLGGVTYIVTACFGGFCQAGEAWRLYIRKVCHLTRWAFRSFHDGWALQRVYPVDMEQKEPQASDQPGQEQQAQTDQDAGLLPDAEQLIFADNVVAVSHDSFVNEDEKRTTFSTIPLHPHT